MVYENIRQYLGSQNFAQTTTNSRDICILRNREGAAVLYVVLIDNARAYHWTASQLQSIDLQLKHMGRDSSPFRQNQVLFVVVTADTERDKYLAKLPDVAVWFADVTHGALIIYEDQPEDFYGLRRGIELSIAGHMEEGVFTKENFPFVTAALIALNVIYFIVLRAMGDTESSLFMIRMGGNFGPFVFKDYQFWRLITSMFMHFSLMHLAGNMVYLGLFGYYLEKAVGRWKFLALYMLAGIGASLISAAYYFLRDPNTVSAGASGAVYGLMGAMLYLSFLNRGRMRPAQMFLRFGVILIFVFYSFFVVSAGVDAAAHIGGFVFGLLLSILFLHPAPAKKDAGRSD